MKRAPHLVVLLALTLAIAAFPAGADAMTYKHASRIALRTLAPERARTPVVLFGLPHAVSSRSRVFEVARGLAKPRLGRIGRRSYLFWLDQAPGAMFMHPSTLLLVDARSGKIVRREHYLWWPLVNGKRPAFLASGGGYNGSRYRLFESISASGSRVRPRVSAAQSGGGGALAGTCMVLVTDSSDPLLDGSVAGYRNLASKLGIPLREAGSAVELDNGLSALQSSGCKNVLVSVVAHGEPAKWSEYPRVSVFTETTRDGDIVRPKQTNLDEPDFANILDAHRGLTYSLTFTSCYSGRWLNALDADQRLTGKIRVIVTSSSPEEATYGLIRIPRWPLLPKTPPLYFDQGFVPAIANQYTPDAAGGQTGPALDQAIANAFPDGYNSAKGRVVAGSTPQLSNHLAGTITVDFGVTGDFTNEAQDRNLRTARARSWRRAARTIPPRPGSTATRPFHRPSSGPITRART